MADADRPARGDVREQLEPERVAERAEDVDGGVARLRDDPRLRHRQRSGERVWRHRDGSYPLSEPLLHKVT